MYVGNTPEQMMQGSGYRYFYGLRRTDDGELIFGRLDYLKNDDSLTINKPGNPADDFTNFAEGQDFLEGRDIEHELVYKNLNFEQFVWDNKNIFFYINDDGEFVVSVNRKVKYDNE